MVATKETTAPGGVVADPDIAREGEPNARKRDLEAYNSEETGRSTRNMMEDYYMHMMLLEQQNKKRLIMAREEQDQMVRDEIERNRKEVDDLEGGVSPARHAFDDPALEEATRAKEPAAGEKAAVAEGAKVEATAKSMAPLQEAEERATAEVPVTAEGHTAVEVPVAAEEHAAAEGPVKSEEHAAVEDPIAEKDSKVEEPAVEDLVAE